MTPALRMELASKSLELIAQTGNAKENSLTLVSVGAGGLYQELVYLAQLAQAGYQKIRFIGIDQTLLPLASLEEACKAFIPSSTEITIENRQTDGQPFSLDAYVQQAKQDETFQPDLLLLIDLTDDQYKVSSQLLSDYAFGQFLTNQLLKADKTVICHSALETISTQKSATISKIEFVKTAHAAIFTSEATSLSSLVASTIEERESTEVWQSEKAV